MRSYAFHVLSWWWYGSGDGPTPPPPVPEAPLSWAYLSYSRLTKGSLTYERMGEG